MAAGLPIVASNVTAIPELVTDDVGLLVSPHDPSEISETLIRLLNDANLRQQLGSAGKSRVLSFEISRVGASFLSAVEQVMKNPVSSGHRTP